MNQLENINYHLLEKGVYELLQILPYPSYKHLNAGHLQSFEKHRLKHYAYLS